MALVVSLSPNGSTAKTITKNTASNRVETIIVSTPRGGWPGGSLVRARLAPHFVEMSVVASMDQLGGQRRQTMGVAFGLLANLIVPCTEENELSTRGGEGRE